MPSIHRDSVFHCCYVWLRFVWLSFAGFHLCHSCINVNTTPFQEKLLLFLLHHKLESRCLLGIETYIGHLVSSIVIVNVHHHAAIHFPLTSPFDCMYLFSYRSNLTQVPYRTCVAIELLYLCYFKLCQIQLLHIR